MRICRKLSSLWRRPWRAVVRPVRGARTAPGSPPLGSISALIDELARAPEHEYREAWDRGLRAGDVVGKFELVRELGRGGFGVVFEASDRELHRRVAFKAIRPGPPERNPARAALLLREGEAVAQLQHPSIVTLHDAGRCEGGPYLVFELLRGETLARRIERGPVPVRTANRIALDVARALVHAHEQGVLHRDLKPGNVFLAEDGGVKVLDFGLAHVFGGGGPAHSGTPGYMAPEQLRGGAEDARTDVFALGVLLHEMLTGRRLFAGSPEPDAAVPPRQAAPLDVKGAPPGLSRLVARMLEPDPARRPRRASEVLRALARADQALSAGVRRTRSRRKIAAAIAAAAIVGFAIGVRWFFEAGTRTRIAVADVQNETGDPDLDGVSGMLATSLDESKRIAVVPRARMIDRAATTGRLPERLDAAAAVKAGRDDGVRMVLLPLLRRVPDSAPALELIVRAVDPKDGHEHFVASGQSESRAGIQDLVDAVSVRIRRNLKESEADVYGTRIRIRDITPDLEAYRHYLNGQACAMRPVIGQDCGAEFRKAIARGPTFALAYYELAVWSYWNGGSIEEQRTAIREATAHAAGAPAKEQTLIGAWNAYLAGRADEALELYRYVTVRWPEDPHAWMQIADILRRRDENGAAIPALESAAKVDPGPGWAIGFLAECLGATGQRDHLRESVREWERAVRPATLHGLSVAYGWLGDPRHAAHAADRSVSMGVGLLAQQDRLAAMVFAGDYSAAEPGIRALAAPQSDVRALGTYGLAALEAYQGRRRAGLEALDALRRELPAVESSSLYLTLRIDYLLGGGRPEEVWRELQALRAISPSDAAEHAPALAWLGDVEHARELAAGLRPGSPYERAYEAIVAWRGGYTEGALERLRTLSRSGPCATWRVAPVYLLAEVASASGHDAEAIEAIQRFHAMYVPLTMWRSWAYPRSLVLLARSQERLGQVERARETLDRFLTLWASADASDPLFAEARAARARLAP